MLNRKTHTKTVEELGTSQAVSRFIKENQIAARGVYIIFEMHGEDWLVKPNPEMVGPTPIVVAADGSLARGFYSPRTWIDDLEKIVKTGEWKTDTRLKTIFVKNPT